MEPAGPSSSSSSSSAEASEPPPPHASSSASNYASIQQTHAASPQAATYSNGEQENEQSSSVAGASADEARVQQETAQRIAEETRDSGEEEYPDPPEEAPQPAAEAAGTATPAPALPQGANTTASDQTPTAQQQQAGNTRFQFRTFMDSVLLGLRNAAATALADQVAVATGRDSGEAGAAAGGDGQGSGRADADGEQQRVMEQDAASGATGEGASTGTNADQPPPQQSGSSGTTNTTTSSSSNLNNLSPPLYFRLPFASTNGRPAVVRFQPTPLPPIQFPFGAGHLGPASSQRQQGQQEEPHIPVQPIFIPLGASPLPFAFLYDTITSTAWPVAEVAGGLATPHQQQESGAAGAGAGAGAGAASGQQEQQQHQPPGGFPTAPPPDQQRAGMAQIGDASAGAHGGEGEHDPHRPTTFQFVTGPPFRISLAFTAPGEQPGAGGGGTGGPFGGPFGGLFGHPPAAPQPDPEKARAFVDALERADSELRVRMARLGMGDIGAYAMGEGRGALGCGICLEGYSEEDRPEWIAGQSGKDAEVVAVPCPGHHTLHAGCLREWLESKPPSQWTCPFCREPLDEKQIHAVLAGEAKEKAGTSGRSLREEVRFRERQHGWRCDAPACLPRYPPSDLPAGEGGTISSTAAAAHDTAAAGAASDDEDGDEFLSTKLVTLSPCKHQIHVDCLCTALRVEDDLKDANDDDDESVAESSATEDDDDEMEDADEDVKSDDTHHAVSSRRIPRRSLDQHAEDVGSDDELEIGLTSRGKQARDRKTGEFKTIGKWISCPACRREAWAAIPARRRRRRRNKEKKQHVYHQVEGQQDESSAQPSASLLENKMAPLASDHSQGHLTARERMRMEDEEARRMDESTNV